MKNTYKLFIMGVFFVVVFLLSFALGRYSISVNDVTKILLSKIIPISNTWSEQAYIAVFEIRMPRILAATLIGASLSCAGCIYQGLFKNPMVSPEILGASNGAAFGAAIAILLNMSYFTTTAISFTMGLVSVAIAYIVSERSQGDKIFSMVLSGIMVSSIFSALISFIKLIADTENTLPLITYWLMGSLASSTTRDVTFASIPIVVSLIPLLLLRWRINLLTLDDEEALTMGVNLPLLKIIVIVCATLMTSASVSISGIIGWVGLVIPHFARLIVGYDYRHLLPASCICGATFLIAVDTVARNITTSEIPLGILTSLIGAPIFLYLIYKNKR